MKKANLPPIYKKTEQLLLLIEQAVRGFSRYHKYTIGTDLRQQAMACMRTVHKAVWKKQPSHVTTLMEQLDDLKLTLQLAKQIGAFSSIKIMAPIAELTAELGKQCGGWQRSLANTNNAKRRP